MFWHLPGFLRHHLILFKVIVLLVVDENHRQCTETQGDASHRGAQLPETVAEAFFLMYPLKAQKNIQFLGSLVFSRVFRVSTPGI